MSTAPNEEPDIIEGSLRFTTGAATDKDPEERAGARTPFYLDDDNETVYWAVRPKKAKLLSFVRGAEALVVGADASMEAAAAAMGVYDSFLNSILAPESRELLEERLQDDKDEFDLDHLDPIIHGLVEHWFARPTGRPRASQGSRSQTGKRSTGRVRSTGQTRKR